MYSFSRIDTFNTCKKRFKLRYIDKLEPSFSYLANDARTIGKIMHLGIEKGVDEAIQEYEKNYPMLSDSHINEEIKFKILIPKVEKILRNWSILNFEYELKASNFIGYIDLITNNSDGTVNIYDFKYSNNVKHYKESSQLHIYKYFLEKEGYKVNKLGLIFIPKSFIRMKKNETIFEFRNRLKKVLDDSEIKIEYIKYNKQLVEKFFDDIKVLEHQKVFRKTSNKDFCKMCDYKLVCEERNYVDMLPKVNRIPIGTNKNLKLWLYGQPFSGKSTFVDKAPNPLSLNTDGNLKFLTMPRLEIRDTVIKEGRMIKKTLAWDNFKSAIEELESEETEFKTIIVDLLEDTLEMCRVSVFEILNIQHESDSGFGKGWDRVKTDFLNVIKRLLNLNDKYNIVLISHEDLSKELTKGSGEKITRIAPNIRESLANKISGMVDLVGRIVIKNDGSRIISFKQDNVIFGGGRLNINEEISLDWNELIKSYEKALKEKEGKK